MATPSRTTDRPGARTPAASTPSGSPLLAGRTPTSLARTSMVLGSSSSPGSVRRSVLLPSLGAERQPIVLDIGTVYTKCGFANEPTPRHVLPSTVELADGSVVSVFDWSESRAPAVLRDVIARFLFNIFYKFLLVKAAERRVVVCESLLTPTVFRSTLADVLFNNFQVLSVLFAPLPVLSLLPLAVNTALVVDVGYEETSVIAVSEGIPLLNSLVTVPLGGKALHRRISELIMKHGRAWQGGDLRPVVSLTSSIPEDVLEDIKTRVCLVACKSDNRKAATVAYPHEGIRLELDHAVRVQAANVLFEDDDEDESIPVAVLKSLSKCPVDIRKQLISNVSVIGGSSMLPGFKQRLMEDLRDLLKTKRFPRLQLKENRVVAIEATLQQTGGDFGKLNFITDSDAIQKHILTALGCEDKQIVDFSLSEQDGHITARVGVLQDVDVAPLLGSEAGGQRRYVVNNVTKKTSDISAAMAFHDSMFPANTIGWLGGALFGALDFLGEKSVSRESYLKTPTLPDWNCQPNIAVADQPAPSTTTPARLRSRLSLAGQTPTSTSVA
eukprot:m.486088 g.486088  ORF g.486088 m.486088 type:complete len:555 (-) comp24179_c0_seq1:147-1811(-)